MDWDKASAAFEARVHYEPNSGCWLWAGADNGEGYGKFRGKYAHRLSYERHKGPIPDGLHLDHLCRMPCCINPDHLEPVTNAENARRGMAGHHMKDGGGFIGDRHPGRRINSSAVVALRKKYSSGVSQYELSKEFGISQPTVSQIVRRVTWDHIQ